jgi:plasmid stability protein
VKEVTMPDLLVRKLGQNDYDRLRRRAKARGKSLGETAREILAEHLRPTKKELWTEINQFRERIGPLPGDSTADIREWRDNAKSYR